MAKYLYGNITTPLPDINSVYTPELQAKYPYAFIYYESDSQSYCLGICASVPSWNVKSNIGSIKASTTMWRFDLSEEKDRWIPKNTVMKVALSIMASAHPFKWANVDIYNTGDRTGICCAASEPVLSTEPDGDEPTDPGGGESVAYLYNGVKLPPPPKSDYPYPYSYIYRNPIGRFYFAILETPLYYTQESGEGVLRSYEWTHYRRWDYAAAEGKWAWNSLSHTGSVFEEIGTLVWCDHDTMDANGNLYMAASEPVPVGGEEPAPLDPKSMLMGWIVGRRIAGQRK